MFPSFHTVWALLLVAACPRPFKPVSAGLNAAVIVATLTTGWHYLSDVLAGVVVYYAVCCLCSTRGYWPMICQLATRIVKTPRIQEGIWRSSGK